jgi:hypothetical protein
MDSRVGGVETGLGERVMGDRASRAGTASRGQCEQAEGGAVQAGAGVGGQGRGQGGVDKLQTVGVSWQRQVIPKTF